MQYTALEPSSLSSIGVKAPAFDGADVSFYATSSFIYTLFFIAILLAAFYEYVLVGIYRMEASESGIKKSNEVFKRTTLGLLGVFSLFLIIFMINKGLLTGDIGLDALKAKVTAVGGGLSGGTVGIGQPGGSAVGSGGAQVTTGSAASCESTAATISKLQSSGGICGGTACSALSGCEYQKYLPFINAEVGDNSQLKKMIIVTLCRESKAKPTSTHINTNGTIDCGLMQINQPSTCSAEILDPATNIRLGVKKMKEKIASTQQVYPNIPAETGPFSSYNCCANKTVPNSPSVDCNTSVGFTSPIPKWACPINPGDSVTNMCFVKGYVCDLSACMGQL